VVEIPVERRSPSEGPPEPRDLLPWADPYIAQLVVKHQMQVEARQRRSQSDRMPPDPFHGR
jgi:hypothetical protein